MSKYLYLDTNEMEYLTEKAFKLKMVFKRPNEVLKDVLGFTESTGTIKQKGRKVRLPRQDQKSLRKKIRVDEEVWSAWKQIRAKACGRSEELDQVVEWFLELPDENKDIKKGGLAKRPSARPATK